MCPSRGLREGTSSVVYIKNASKFEGEDSAIQEADDTGFSRCGWENCTSSPRGNCFTIRPGPCEYSTHLGDFNVRARRCCCFVAFMCKPLSAHELQAPRWNPYECVSPAGDISTQPQGFGRVRRERCVPSTKQIAFLVLSSVRVLGILLSTCSQYLPFFFGQREASHGGVRGVRCAR